MPDLVDFELSILPNEKYPVEPISGKFRVIGCLNYTRA